MAAGLAEEAYRAGYRRGYEWAEREEGRDEELPEAIADAEAPGWRHRRALDGDGEVVVDERDHAGDLAAHLAAAGARDRVTG
jgi:hypothetical protein